ncbi:EamA family transporter RarD [Paracoccus sp. (in: a-proteobacteria)]|uniref:EamA family transporter RarD n=1 Tax=Paracoccus sp. TaxID=267 RepID=UPI003220268D
MSEWTRGFAAVIGVCLVWGLSPIYYRLLVDVPVVEVLAQRTIWSLLLFLLILGLQGRLALLRDALAGPQLGRIALAATAVSVNWGIFIWAVQAGHVVQSSLGYYIFPLVAVLIGLVLFGERLSRAQGLAVVLAGLAVTVLTWGLGVVPWISLGLALSMGLYGAAKKALTMDPVVSVAAEVALLTPLALGWLALQGAGLMPAALAHPVAFGESLRLALLLAFTGPITAVPLILFSYGARRVPLATLGLTFYLNPTLQFLCAVLLFAEPLTRWHVIAFAVIWGALALYSASALRQARRAAPLANG